MTATAAAGLLSGAPSTAHALLTGADPLAATRAAGTMLPGHRPGILRGALAHAAVSTLWGTVLALALPRRHTVAWGAAAGLLIAALDLGVVARRFPAIRALPTAPQVADHVAFGAIVGVVLASGDRSRR
jgi:hypothetical protein